MIIKLYKGHNLEAYFQFNGTGTNRLNWLSRNNIMNSSYRDLPGPEISYAKIRWKDQFHSNTSLLTIFMSMNINISILKNNDYTWKINNFVEQYIRCPKVGITKCKYWWQMKLYSLKNINSSIPVLNYNTNFPLPVTEKTIIRDIGTKFFFGTLQKKQKTNKKLRNWRVTWATFCKQTWWMTIHFWDKSLFLNERFFYQNVMYEYRYIENRNY